MKRLFCLLLLGLCLSCSFAFAELKPMDSRETPVTYRLFIRDSSMPPAADNPYLLKIQELTGVTISFEFLSGDLDQTIDVMIASGKYPDAIFAAPEKFINAGAYIPLETLIEENCPHLYAYYQPWWDAMKAEDGHIYVLEIFGLKKYQDAVLQNEGAGFWLQKRVLEFGGYSIPRTLEEYFELIECYLQAYPETDGHPTVGFGVLCDGWLDYCLRNPPLHLLGAGNDGDAYVDPTTLQASLYQFSPTAKAYYRKLNEEYHKGILSAETMMQSEEQYLNLISSGCLLGMFDQHWNFAIAETALREAGRYEMTYISLPITADGVQDGYLDAPSSSFTGSNGLGITVNCENPLRLLKYYDWLIREEVQTYLYWGAEGKDYIIDENGRYHLTEARRKVYENEALRRDRSGWVLANYSPKMQGLYCPDGNACDPMEQPEEYKARMSEYDKEFLDAYGFQCDADFLSPPVKRLAYYPVWSMLFEQHSAAQTAHDELIALCRKYDPRLILCPAEEYDTVWAEFVAAAEAAELQPYLNEVQRQIRLRMTRP